MAISPRLAISSFTAANGGRPDASLTKLGTRAHAAAELGATQLIDALGRTTSSLSAGRGVDRRAARRSRRRRTEQVGTGDVAKRPVIATGADHVP